MFYEVLMEKKAEADYHSRYLSREERLKGFDAANARRSARTTGDHSSRNMGGVLGAVGGGILGAAHGGGTGGVVGGLLGGGVGYGLGYLGDKARDASTIRSRKIQEMSPKERARILDHRRAQRLDEEDHEQRMENFYAARDAARAARDSREALALQRQMMARGR